MNLYKCLYWNQMMYHEACMRRGLNPELYSFENFIKVAKRIGIEFVEKNSVRYKIGSFIVDPILRLLSYFRRV